MVRTYKQDVVCLYWDEGPFFWLLGRSRFPCPLSWEITAADRVTEACLGLEFRYMNSSQSIGDDVLLRISPPFSKLLPLVAM